MTVLLSDSSTDLVAILDNESLQQLFTASSPMRVTVRETKKVTEFAVEDGTTRSDHTTFNPIEVVVDLFISDELARNGYEAIRQAWRDDVLVTIQTRVSTYPDMMIVDMPHDQSNSGGGSITIPVRMQEWRTYEPQYGELPMRKVANPNQSSTVDKGQAQTTETSAPTKKRASVLYEVLN